ncbi:MAG: pyridoxamine 5'-phosphate oxidase family protein [Pseudomonadota bacterium]
MTNDTTASEGGRAFAKIAFSQSVQKIQETLGSRGQMSKMQIQGRHRAELDDNLIQFVQSRISFYLGTASSEGIPYIQHRGGEFGFIEIVDNATLRIPDYPGNQQYITLGNLQENPPAFIFMMDYEIKARLKIWGTAEVENLDSENRSLLFHIEAWDMNCSKHLPDYYSMSTVKRTMEKLTTRIAELEAEIYSLKG